MIDCNKIKNHEHADSLEAKQSVYDSDDFRCVLTLEHLGLIFGCTFVFPCIGSNVQG